MKLYRAIIINPERRIVEPINTLATHEATSELIGASGLDNFRVADHGDSWDYGFVNDTGLSDGKPIHAFLLSVRKDPIAGRCVLIGAAKQTGETCDAKFPLDILRANITWLGLIRPEVTWDHTETGSRAIVTYERVLS